MRLKNILSDFNLVGVYDYALYIKRKSLADAAELYYMELFLYHAKPMIQII